MGDNAKMNDRGVTTWAKRSR